MQVKLVKGIPKHKVNTVIVTVMDVMYNENKLD